MAFSIMTDMNPGERPVLAFSFLKHKIVTGEYKCYTGNQVTQTLFIVKRVETGKVHRTLRMGKGSKAMFKAFTN